MSLAASGLPSVLALLAVAAVVGYWAGSRWEEPLHVAHDQFAQSQAELAAMQHGLHAAETALNQARDKTLNAMESLLGLEDKLHKARIAAHARTAAADKAALADPPCRQNAIPPANADLPIYVFVAGIEGAGHHALETVWETAAEYYDVHVTAYNPGLHSMAKAKNVSRAYQFASPDFKRYRNTLANFLKRKDIADKKIIIDSRNSYPMGFGSGAMTHPDLLYLSQLDGDLFDLRVLLIYRDPTACVVSAVRRFKVGEFQYKNHQFQARAVEESLCMMNNAVPSLPCGKVAWLRYESFVTQPQQYAGMLSQLLSVRKEHIDLGFGKIQAPSKSKHDDKIGAEGEQQLKLFFEHQQHLWPVMAGVKPLPPLVDVRSRLPTRRRASDGAGDSSSNNNDVSALAPGRYLAVDWMLHLGFNNMRFLIEMGFGMAQQLRRHLLLPSHLRMRKCVNEELCKQSSCEIRTRGHDVSYWCPLTMFLDEHSLTEVGGGVIVEDVAAFAQQLGQKNAIEKVQDAFKQLYDETQLWIDNYPVGTTAADFSPESHRYTGTHKAATIYRYHMGCEMSYFRVVSERWDLKASPEVHVFREAFASDAPILHLKGTPHKIGMTPFVWSTQGAAAAADTQWTEPVTYAASIKRYAAAIKEELLKDTGAQTFVCVHLRRGDFVTAGWLGQASNLTLVQQNIAAVLHSKEALYMATDETSPQVLGGFRKLGARIWVDFAHVLAEENQRPESAPFASHLGFEDYVGLVEQYICGQARAFLGSQCSSFTGGILNLRRKLVGDLNYLTVARTPKDTKK